MQTFPRIDIYKKNRQSWQRFLAKPRYATFQKIVLKIAHFTAKLCHGWLAILRRRRTVRYFFAFAMLHASFSFGVSPIESRSGCDGVTLFMSPVLVTLRGLCEVPPRIIILFFFWPDRVDIFFFFPQTG